MQDGYSICFNKWALDKNIKNELGLLLILSSLCAKNGFCYASNEYLSNLFDTTEVSISRKIKKLESQNYIITKYKYNGSQIINREISINDLSRYQKNQWPLTKMLTAVNKNVKDNITSNNNTSNKNNINNKEINKESQELFDYDWLHDGG